MDKRWLLIGMIFCIPTILQGQGIKGRVFDVNNQLPLAGANVHWQNSTTGTSTDESGYFELNEP